MDHEVRSLRPAWTTRQNPISTKNTKLDQARWFMPVIPVLWEAEMRGWLEARSLRPAWPLSLQKITKKINEVIPFEVEEH